MRTFFPAMVKTLIVLIAMLFFLFGAAMGFIYSPFFRFPGGEECPPPRIRQLIWPTIGYPALVTPGGALEVEVDLRPPGEGGPQPVEVSSWEAEITAAREELEGLSFTLEPREARTAVSARWPSESREVGGEPVWRVRFDVPAEAPPELYDLRVTAVVGGEGVCDGQPHAVAVTPDTDSDFTFITLSDIHVHGRGNSTLAVRQSDKGIGEDGRPLFLEEAIDQVNLIRPDFVLMLGDYVRGQRRPGDLLEEYTLFYQAILDLEVPAFILPGNHDQYVNGIDGLEYFEENMGPQYFSFDVGECHFTCLNSYQWPREDRVVMNKLLYMDPNKWQGQLLGAEDERDESTYRGELAWARDDLEAHRGARLRVMAMHHDPYTGDGKGYSFNPVVKWNIPVPGGGGKGKAALRELASSHRVDMVFGGHLHVDWVGWEPWEGGGGETVYSCQTCVYFDDGGRSDHYPGYRLVEVEEGRVKGFSYLDGESSYPFYDRSVPGGVTDLEALNAPALEEEAVSSGADGDWSASLKVTNRLGVHMTLSGLVVPAPRRPGNDYLVEGGEIYATAPLPARPGWVLLYLRATAGAGIPGGEGGAPAQPSLTTVSVR